MLYRQSMSFRSFSDQRGFTIVELLTAVIVSTIVIMAIYGSYIVSRKSFEVQEETVSIQQEARIAMLTIEKDIRQAGSMFGFLTERTFFLQDGGGAGGTDILNIFGVQTVERLWPDDPDSSLPQYCFQRLNVFPIEGWAFSGGEGTMLLDIGHSSLGCPACDCSSSNPREESLMAEQLSGAGFLITLSGPAVGGGVRCAVVETTGVVYDPVSGNVPAEGDTPANFLLVDFSVHPQGNELCPNSDTNLEVIGQSGRFPVSVGSVYSSGGGDTTSDTYNAYLFSGEYNARYSVTVEEIPDGSGLEYSILRRNDEILLRGVEDIQFAFIGKSGSQMTESCGPASSCNLDPMANVATLQNIRAVRVSMVLTEEEKNILMDQGNRGLQRGRAPTPRMNIENRVWDREAIPAGDEYFVRRAYTNTVRRKHGPM